MQHLTMVQLEAGLDDIRRSPADDGTLDLIVRRPSVGVRETVAEAELDRAGSRIRKLTTDAL